MKTLHVGIVSSVVLVVVYWVLVRSSSPQQAAPVFSSPFGEFRKESLQDALVGKWKGHEKSIEFFSDGSFAMNSASKRVAGRWNVVAKNRVKLTASAFGIEVITTLDDIVLAENKLKATAEGNVVEFSLTK